MQVDIPGYRIIRTLGRGGMARVYLAIQESFEREVALKVLDPQLSEDPAFGERFLREARIVSRLVHPNIVTVYDVGVHQGCYFLSMEYIPGQELAFRRVDLTLEQGLGVIRDVARALDFAGKKGYVHRDVKPENIMLHDEDGRAVLMDFGIARPSDMASGMTRTGTAIGTPHYMSPEQAKGLPVDSRADIYGLGVVLFLLLTGRVPYHADSAVVVGIMHISEEIPRLPGQLQIFQPIIDRALAKRPEDRYQTAAELIADLDALAPESLEQAEATRQQLLAEEAAANEAELAAWATTQEILANREPTPGFDAAPGDATLVVPSLEETRVIHPPGGLVLGAEDRVIHYSPPPARRSGIAWLVALLLAAGISGAVYLFRADIQAYLTPVSPVAHAPLDADEQGLEQLVDIRPRSSAAALSSSAMSDTAGSPAESETLPEVSGPVLPDGAPSDGAPGDDTPGDESGESPPLDTAAATDTTEAEPVAGQETPPDAEAPSVLETRLAEAEAYLARDALGSPPGANALEIYRAILQEDPGQPQALDGLQRIAGRYAELAQAREQQGQPEQALELVRRGLSVANDHPALFQLNTRLETAVESRRRHAAREAALIQEIQASMALEDIRTATSLLASAQVEFPESQALQKLALDLEKAAEEARPRVIRLRVGAQDMSQLPEEQPSTIAADRVIYLGFDYRNFASDASVIQAILYDGSRSMQIVQVPVVVSGAEGVRFFRMEQPVSGFAEGGYSIDLLLDHQTLISERFNVKR